MIRLLDIIFSLCCLILYLPFLLIIILCIPLDSNGGIFFLQSRVGRNGKDFRLIKFRTMVKDAQRAGGLTIGARDARITRAGLFLRKFKLDEVPQLINVLKGDMSLVGPRPELKRYVEMYSDEQWKILSVRPGMTDFASIEYIRENEILGRSANPEETYIREVMPHKIDLNLRFINDPSVKNYLLILWKTACSIFRRSDVTPA